MAKNKKFSISRYLSKEEIEDFKRQEVKFLKEGLRLRLELIEKMYEIIQDEKKRVSVNELANAVKLINSELRATMKELGNLERALDKLSKSGDEIKEQDEIVEREFQELLSKASKLEEQIKEFAV